MDDLLSLRRAAASSLLDRIGRSNRGFGSMETRSFVRFARSRMAGYCRLYGRPDLARACLANRRYDCGLVRSRSGTRTQKRFHRSNSTGQQCGGPALISLSPGDAGEIVLASLYSEGSQDSEPIILRAAVINGFCADRL